MTEVRLSRRAVKDLDAPPKRAAARILNALERLVEDSESETLDVKPLVGRRPWRRSRIGNHRIVFRPTDGGRVLLIARIIDRMEIDRALRSLPG